MDFYQSWNNVRENNIKDDSFFEAFLKKAECTLSTLHTGTNEELISFSKLLLSIPIKEFINHINNPCIYNSENIVQYSNFEHAITNVISCLAFNEEPLTFVDLGKLIMHSKKEGACKKYGENHAKLAAELSMATLKRESSVMVTETAFGKFSLHLSSNDKLELIKRLALRNEFIQTMIYNSKKGNADYHEMVKSVLSHSTALRRKNNVRHLIKLILENDSLYNKTRW